MRIVNAGRAIAAFMVAFQSLIALSSALVVFASAHRASHWGLGDALARRHAELGAVLLLAAAAACIVAVSLALDAGWARIAAIAIETLVIAGAIARIGAHPVAALLAIAFAGVVIVLLAGDGDEDGFGDQATHAPGPHGKEAV